MATTTPRQLIVLCDGTNNNLTGGREDTHLVRLAELLRACPDTQRLVFYDPGVGNAGALPGATLLDTLRRRVERIDGLAFGRGAYENMAECYQFLMAHYRPGDQIFLFGFSRGAFTARSVAGLISQFGLLAPAMASMVPTLLHLYFADRGDKAHWEAVSRQAARLGADPATRHVDIDFVGVWDTVATLGMWPFNARFTTPPTVEGKAFVHVRHALALDEHRAQFRPRPYASPNGPFATRSGRTGSLTQLWFSGAHCDVGGGYAPQANALALPPFGWLIAEAVRCGLRLEHDGRPLDDEALALQALARVLEQAGIDPAPTAVPRVNSELHATPLWALTGLALREPARIHLDGQPDPRIRPFEHPSVDALALRYPADTVWAGPRPSWATAVCLVLIPVLLLALGQLLHGVPRSSTGLWAALVDGWRDVGVHWRDYLGANLALAHWQLLGPFGAGWASAPAAWAAPRWALGWDLALIACYAQVLAWGVTAAFVRHAGLRRIGDPAPLWLDRLGWALPLMVGADIAEDAASALVLTLQAVDAPLLAALLGVVMMACAALKWLGLAGTLALIAVGVVAPRR